MQVHGVRYQWGTSEVKLQKTVSMLTLLAKFNLETIFISIFDSTLHIRDKWLDDNVILCVQNKVLK